MDACCPPERDAACLTGGEEIVDEGHGCVQYRRTYHVFTPPDISPDKTTFVVCEGTGPSSPRGFSEEERSRAGVSRYDGRP